MRRKSHVRFGGAAWGNDPGESPGTAPHVDSYWSHGGPTALDNLVLVCGYHHGELHKPDSWTAFIDTDGLPAFVPPTHIDPLQRPRRNKYHRRQ